MTGDREIVDCVTLRRGFSGVEAYQVARDRLEGARVELEVVSCREAPGLVDQVRDIVKRRERIPRIPRLTGPSTLGAGAEALLAKVVIPTFTCGACGARRTRTLAGACDECGSLDVVEFREEEAEG